MNITFLIGNGFDIGMGIKSQFTDYFPIYIDESKRKEERLQGLSKNINMNKKEWSYFEYQLGQYTTKFSPETKQDFIDQVKDFEKGFIRYLESQENCLSFDESDKIAQTMKKALLNFRKAGNIPNESASVISSLFNKYRTEEHRYNFITFNYTSILEKCLDTIKDGIVDSRQIPNYGTKFDKVGKIVHVHGSSDRYPIMGVNDVSQIANQELAKDTRFLKYIVKPSINEMLRMSYDREASELINNSSVLCIYGMSLGVTDRKWWDKILNWLNADNARQLVLYVYDPDYVSSTPYGFIEKEDEIIDLLTEQSLSDVDADKLRKRIHIAIHRNIFEIDLVSRKGQVTNTGNQDASVLTI